MSVSRKTIPVKRQYRSMSVKAGVLAGSTYPADEYTNHKTKATVQDNRGGMPTAVIAMALEYGSRQRVARPFMHWTVAEKQKTWVRDLRKLIQSGMSPPEAFATLGQIMKEDLQHTISTWPADNSTEWAEIKGYNHGLLMTSHLLNSIEFEVSNG